MTLHWFPLPFPAAAVLNLYWQIKYVGPGTRHLIHENKEPQYIAGPGALLGGAHSMCFLSKHSGKTL